MIVDISLRSGCQTVVPDQRSIAITIRLDRTQQCRILPVSEDAVTLPIDMGTVVNLNPPVFRIADPVPLQRDLPAVGHSDRTSGLTLDAINDVATDNQIAAPADLDTTGDILALMSVLTVIVKHVAAQNDIATVFDGDVPAIPPDKRIPGNCHPLGMIEMDIDHLTADVISCNGPETNFLTITLSAAEADVGTSATGPGLYRVP